MPDQRAVATGAIRQLRSHDEKSRNAGSEESLVGHTDSPGHERSAGLLRSGEHVRFELVIPLIEIEVAAAPFDFAALRVDGVGPEMLLGRHEWLAEIVVERDAVGVEPA